MILYLDTSAMVKLFVAEVHSDRVRRAITDAQLVTTHAIAYVEACAAFARVAQVRGVDALFSNLRNELDRQWAAWEILNVTDSLLRRAGDLAGRYRVRGYDSLHLAAAASTFEVFHHQVPFRFVVFDRQLRAAAKHAGIPMLET